jgi:hypothetical protein
LGISEALCATLGKINEDKGKAAHVLKHHTMKMYEGVQV